MASSTRRVGIGLPSNPRARQPPQPPSSPRKSEEPRQARTMPAPRPRNAPSHRVPVLDTNRRFPSTRQRDHYDRGRAIHRPSDSSSTSSSETNSYLGSRGISSQRSSRTTVSSEDEITFPARNTYQDSKAYSFAATTNGYVWTRVAEVANVFTQEVSRVWAAGLGAGDDEGETHLVEVMRAYHLAKARTPSDLPEWLFNERERGQGGLLRMDPPIEDPASRHRSSNTMLSNPTPLSKGFKDSEPSARPKLSSADRLKQLRSARREQGA